MDLFVTEEILEVIKGNVSLNEARAAMLPIDTNQGTQQIPMMLDVPLKNNYITPLGIQMLQSLNICIEGEIDKNAKSVRLGIYGGIFTFIVISDGVFCTRKDGKQENTLLMISKDIKKTSENDFTTEAYAHDDSPECPICKSEMQKKEKVVILPCNPKHLFHQVCFISWCWKSNRCPICWVRFGNFRLKKDDTVDNDESEHRGKEQHQPDSSKKGC
jgi:hypothetical protein